MCLHKLLLALSLFWTFYDQENSKFTSTKFASKLKSPNTLVWVNDVLIIHRHKFHELINMFSLLIKSVYKANPKSPQNSFETFKALKVLFFSSTVTIWFSSTKSSSITKTTRISLSGIISVFFFTKKSSSTATKFLFRLLPLQMCFHPM